MKTLLIILVALVALPLLAGVQQISMRANDWRVTGWSKNTQVYSAAPLRPYFDFPEGTDISVNYMFQSRRPPIVGSERSTRHDTGRAHEALAYALLFSAVAGVVPVLYFHVLLSVALSVVFLGRMACLVAALARQHHSDLPAPIKTFAWTAFGFEVAIMSLGIVTGVVMVFKMLESGALTPLAIIERVRSNSLYKVSAFLSSLGWLTLGVWGLLLHRRLASRRGNTWQTLPT